MSSWFRKPALFSLGVFLFLCSPAFAASSVVIETQIGFDGRFQLGQPFPITVTLAGAGQPTEGILEVQVWKRGGAKGIDAYPVYYRKPVFLAQSRKSIPFTIDPDFLSRPLKVSFSSPTQKAIQEIDLRPHFSTKPLLLLISGTSLPLAIPLPAELTNPLITVALSELPPDPRAYQGVWAVFFYEQPLRELSRAQMFSLETWLLWGGKIVAMGGLSPSAFHDANWERLLPGAPTGLKKLPALSNLEKRYSAQIPGREIWFHDAKLLEGTFLIEEQGHPMLVESSRGKGKVMFLAVDVGRPPLSQWGGLARLFGDVLGTPPEHHVAWEGTWDDTFFARILSTPSFIPIYASLLAFLLWGLTYSVALALLVKYCRKYQPRRAVVVASVFCLPVLFSLAGYFYFDRGGKPLDGILVSATMLDGLGNGYAEAQSNIAVFSTRQRSYRLQMEGGWSDFEAVSVSGGKNENRSLSVIGEGLSSELDFSLGEWSYRLFRMHSMARLPLRVQVQARHDVLRLEVANPSGRALNDCWFVSWGKGFFLGDISPRSNLVRDFPRPAEEGAVKKGWGDISFGDPIRELLFHNSFFSDQNRSEDSSDTAFFVGWFRDGPHGVSTADPRIYTMNYTLFRATFPVQREEEL
jgi:hypothetical protein